MSDFDHLDRDASWPNKPLYEEIDQPFLGYWRKGNNPHSQACEYKDEATAAYYLALGNELLAQGWPVYGPHPFPAPELEVANAMFDMILLTFGIKGDAGYYTNLTVTGWADPVNFRSRFDVSLYAIPSTYPYLRFTSGIVIPHDYPHPIDFNDVLESEYARTVSRIRRCYQARKMARQTHFGLPAH